jgi:molybdopterin converting factor small subunit
MSVKVQFDAALGRLAGGAAEIEVTGQTVRDALFQVARAYPSLHLFNCEGELRGIVRVQRNGQPAALTDALAEGDTLLLHVG